MIPPKVFFLRDPEGHRVACLVSNRFEDGGVIHWALSVHNRDDDTFDAKIGKGVALCRLLMPKSEDSIYIGQVTAGSNVKGEIMRQVAENLDLPHRARHAALYWLKTVGKVDQVPPIVRRSQAA